MTFLCTLGKIIVIWRSPVYLYLRTDGQFHVYIRPWRDICLHRADNRLFICIKAKGRFTDMGYVFPDHQCADHRSLTRVVIPTARQYIITYISDAVRQDKGILYKPHCIKEAVRQAFTCSPICRAPTVAP